MARIIVVDDCPLSIKVIKKHLEKLGHEVLSANGWIEFVAIVAEVQAPVILLDVHMPGVRGDALVGDIREVLSPRTSVLLYSATPEKELAGMAEASGAFGYIHKSFPPNKMIRIVIQGLEAAGDFDDDLAAPGVWGLDSTPAPRPARDSGPAAAPRSAPAEAPAPRSAPAPKPPAGPTLGSRLRSQPSARTRAQPGSLGDAVSSRQSGANPGLGRQVTAPSGSTEPGEQAPTIRPAHNTLLPWREDYGGDGWLPRVLVVEDMNLRRTFLRKWFEKRGFPPIQEAENGEEALRDIRNRAQDDLPQLILTDLEMPILDGKYFVEALKTDPRFDKIEVLLYSSSVTPNEGRAAAAASPKGPDRYLKEVVNFERLERHVSQKIKVLASLRRLERARASLRQDRP